MTVTFKAAVLQQQTPPKRDDAIAQMHRDIAAAAAQGAELIVGQELHSGPYFCQQEDPAVFDRAEALDGPTASALAAAAAEHQVIVVGSIFERRMAGVYHNTALVFERDGSLAGKYRKMHIPQDPGYQEKYYFTPGDLGFEPIPTSLGRLGVLVCWDQWFPEAARLMALVGADVLIYPTAIGWDAADDAAEQQRQFDAWQIIQRGHGVANGLHVLVANRVGFERAPSSDQGQIFWGQSFIAGPQGEILAQADAETAQILTADIDLARTETVRRTWPYLRDRRIDAYDDLLKRAR